MNSSEADIFASKWVDHAVRNLVKGRKKCDRCDGTGSIGYDNNGIWVDAITCDNCHGHGDIPTNDWLDDACGRPRLG